ncbi:MAG: hypothetical protein EOQ97_17160 [Mesorhizobium sp.]|nr:MAG: hypothetical protein EOQ97_17160 [Mesorhizobium sp.]
MVRSSKITPANGVFLTACPVCRGFDAGQPRRHFCNIYLEKATKHVGLLTQIPSSDCLGEALTDAARFPL